MRPSLAVPGLVDVKDLLSRGTLPSPSCPPSCGRGGVSKSDAKPDTSPPIGVRCKCSSTQRRGSFPSSLLRRGASSTLVAGVLNCNCRLGASTSKRSLRRESRETHDNSREKIPVRGIPWPKGRSQSEEDGFAGGNRRALLKGCQRLQVGFLSAGLMGYRVSAQRKPLRLPPVTRTEQLAAPP